MALVRLNDWFRRSGWKQQAANDSHFQGPLHRPLEDEAETLSFGIADFNLHQRDLGAELAERLQLEVCERLRSELGPGETLAVTGPGTLEVYVRNAASVDLERFAEHLIDRVYGEAFCIARALVECELTAH